MKEYRTMKVRVSKTVKAVYGKQWKKEVALLLDSALTGQAMADGEATDFVTSVTMWIDFKVGKKGATVTARPDILPELDECEIRV